MCSIMPACVLPFVQDQEQVDKVRSFSDKIPGLEHVVYDESRGLRDYDHTGLHDFVDVQQAGRAAMEGDPSLAARWEDEIAAGSGEDVSVILYTSGTTGRSKGVMIKARAAVNAALDTVAFDNITERDSVLAYLPLGLGRRPLPQLRSGLCLGLLHELSRKPGDGRPRPARDRADFLLRATPRLRGAADDGHNPHGGCQPPQAPHVRVLHRPGPPPWPRRSSRSGRYRFWPG